MAFDQTVQLDNTCAAIYVLMASIYIAAGLQEDAQKVEAMRNKLALCKNLGNSTWVDSNGNIYPFSTGDIILYQTQDMHIQEYN